MRETKRAKFIRALSRMGALAFGAVIGWVLQVTLLGVKEHSVTSFAAIIAAVAGAALTKIFKPEEGDFGAYCIGLCMGFFVAFIVSHATPIF